VAQPGAKVGEKPSIFTELYHPLQWTVGLANDWFVAGYGASERSDRTLYGGSGQQIARYKRTASRAGVDLGQPWGRFGEFRIGLETRRLRASPTLVAADIGVAPSSVQASEAGLRMAVVVDQLDFANFPQRGYRLVAEGSIGDGSQGGRFQRFEASALAVKTFGAHSFSLHAAASGASQQFAPRWDAMTWAAFTVSRATTTASCWATTCSSRG